MEWKCDRHPFLFNTYSFLLLTLEILSKMWIIPIKNSKTRKKKHNLQKKTQFCCWERKQFYPKEGKTTENLKNPHKKAYNTNTQEAEWNNVLTENQKDGKPINPLTQVPKKQSNKIKIQKKEQPLYSQQLVYSTASSASQPPTSVERWTPPRRMTTWPRPKAAKLHSCHR